MFEIHITIEPVFGEPLTRLKQYTEGTGFKVADLLMVKRPEDTPERSKFDTFMTGHHKEYSGAANMTTAMVGTLRDFGYKVWRYKIEKIIVDSKHADELGLLTHKPG